MTWMETYSGKKFHPLNPSLEEICLEDIVHSLAKACRFGNHLPIHFSVAQHSMICALVARELGCSKKIELYALSHDFSEAYIVDIPRPLKALLPDYKAIEHKVQNKMYEFVGLEPPTEDEKLIIKYIDNLVLYYEGKYLTNNVDGWIEELILDNEDYVAPRDWFCEMEIDIVKSMFKYEIEKLML
ncbi:hypothetical protein [Halalkalibacter oceani]|uniref:hypothetical protein n=1 Tax=Halalkalibacter oceani TaxID=1653776 RepID=UPI003395210E